MAIIAPWQIGNIPGPKRATPLKGEVAARLIRASERPLLAVGSLASEIRVGDELLIDLVAKLGGKIPVVATADVLKGLLERGCDPAASMGVVDLTNRLTDLTWSVNGKGPHDLAIFLGIPYPLQSQMLSTLKHFATNLRTISLDRFFQPNADFSFPNLGEEEWREEILKVLKT